MFRSLLLCCLLAGYGLLAHGGLTAYTDRGQIDFDTALKIINPYGTWSKIDNAWAFTPKDRLAPYTDGRWIYTEYGWYWKGNLPHSWVTEHYGYWKRGGDKVWSWYPGPYWLPQIVEIRITPTYIGWRSAAVNRDGNFIERPDERYAKTDEWTFVTLAQFAGPITPGIVAKPDLAATLLDDSTECRHTYLTYREIDRPGPHPADFLAFCKDGGMFPPKTLEDRLATQPTPPSPIVIPAAIQQKISQMTGTNAPVLLSAEQNQGATGDKRQVKYWITMSLPSYGDKPPLDAKAGEIYLYRPDFYQDEDGIARRITLWFNPQVRVSLKDVLAGNGLVKKPTAESDGDNPESAMPDESGDSSGAFASPLDGAYHGGSASSARASASTGHSGAAPTGKQSDAPIPSPLINATNTP